MVIQMVKKKSKKDIFKDEFEEGRLAIVKVADGFASLFKGIFMVLAGVFKLIGFAFKMAIDGWKEIGEKNAAKKKQPVSEANGTKKAKHSSR